MRLAKMITISSLLMFSIQNAHAQTIFASETFGTGAARGTSVNGFTGDLGTWTQATTGVNGSSANNWYVSGEECGNAAGNCGSACPGGDNSLHVSAIGGLCGTPDCGAAYDESGTANRTNKRAISPTIDCSGYSMIELNFNYIAAQGDDGFWVEYSLDNGSSWTTFTGGNVSASQCCSCLDASWCAFFGICCGPQTQQACAGGEQGYWTAQNLIFPAGADNNPNVRIAFHWSNDGNGFGTDPSVAIDDITLTYATILAVELSDFNGTAEDNINTLTWSTISEANSSHFIIEHSTDGHSYKDIGRVEAAFSSNNIIDYNFMHETSSEINYYRLRSVDMNGKNEYSRSITIENDLHSIHLSRSDGNHIIKGLEEKSGQIFIYDLNGKMAVEPLNFDREMSEIGLNLDQLASGVYIVSVTTITEQKRFKIQK